MSQIFAPPSNFSAIPYPTCPTLTHRPHEAVEDLHAEEPELLEVAALPPLHVGERHPQLHRSVRRGVLAVVRLPQEPNHELGREIMIYDILTGISSEIRTKLRDWAIWQARAGCYSQAALSSNDSKTLYMHLCLTCGGCRGGAWPC